MLMNKERAAIYHFPLFKGDEVNLQELRAYVTAQGWEITEFVEKSSLDVKKRPVLNRLLREAKRKGITAVCIHSLSSIAYSLPHLVAVLDKLRAVEIGVIAVREGLTLNSSASALVEAMQGYMADEKSRKIKIGMEIYRLRTQAAIGRKPTAFEKVQSILQGAESNLSPKENAKRCGVPVSTVYTITKKHREQQSGEIQAVG
jgi:DNA invertase Pin-like site-specific DNA recombinase